MGPEFTFPIVRTVFAVAVDANGVMRAGFALRSGWDRLLCIGVTSATVGERTVEVDRVWASADGTSHGFERAGSCIRHVPKAPTPVTLRNTCVFIRGSEGKLMFAVHERLASQTSELKTRTRVDDVKPDRTGIGRSGIAGNARFRVLVEVDSSRPFRREEDLGKLFLGNRKRLAFVVLGNLQPKVWEVTYFETGLREGDLNSDLSVVRVCCKGGLAHVVNRVKIRLRWNVRRFQGETPSVRRD